MKQLICGIAAAGLLVAGPALADAAARKAPVASDHQLSQRIEHRLARARSLKDEHISVSVKDHVATLTGNVDSRADRMRAEHLARVRGIRRVDDQIAVETRATTGTSGTFGERTKHDVEGLGAKTKAGASKAGEAVSDAWITGRVKTRFVGEDALKHSDINVDTSNHVVTLKGTVASEAGRERAVALAKTTDGVNQVVDRLQIAPHK